MTSISGSLRCHYGDGNQNVKKQLVKISKTTTQHVHHAFLYISLPSLHDYGVNGLVSRLIDNVNIRRRIPLTLFKLGYFSEEFNSSRVRLKVHSSRSQLCKRRFCRHRLRDILNSLLLKVASYQAVGIVTQTYFSL